MKHIDDVQVCVPSLFFFFFAFDYDMSRISRSFFHFSNRGFFTAEASVGSRIFIDSFPLPPTCLHINEREAFAGAHGLV
jgi:hypothetical protein